MYPPYKSKKNFHSRVPSECENEGRYQRDRILKSIHFLGKRVKSKSMLLLMFPKSKSLGQPWETQVTSVHEPGTVISHRQLVLVEVFCTRGYKSRSGQLAQYWDIRGQANCHTRATQVERSLSPRNLPHRCSHGHPGSLRVGRAEACEVQGRPPTQRPRS
ncbi:hypothetical protein HJG60_008662 [Phyllostomus discolor]|uniref:Uncharacterized protein n=1 Tax=Phyllostomus discolor TaxID=89673 RepID=A0A834DI73_9CHIR|nr:hypothetical protein HJG60_008662 [Phyllostomus discolor]